MSSDEIAIRIQNLSKCYQIYDAPHDRLKQFVAPRLQRIMGVTSKQYFRDFWALKNVSFEVKKGETIGIIGRNGSGKSTLLQIICGTLTPTSGTVETNGRIAALLELGSGFNPEFTGRENIYMNATVLGLTKEEIKERYNSIVEFSDIGDFIERPVKTYSSGMVLRLAFSVIAHVDADILVIDEALSVGDAFFTQKCMRYLRKFMEKGSILFVSHDTGAVINFCQRAIWLNKGLSKYQGTPKDAAKMYLAELYESQQGKSVESSKLTNEKKAPTEQLRDMRLKLINSTKLRNDIEIFRFTSGTDSFGKGESQITSVYMTDETSQPLSWVIGGENVKLIITCTAKSAIFNPIIGFYINDRLGQQLFGDNTSNFSENKSLSISPGESFKAEFEFNMPILPMGDYSITAALAEGTQQDHTQHHWIHDAIAFKSHSSSVSTGLIGIPMTSIRIELTK